MSTTFDPWAYTTGDNFLGWYFGGSATPTQPLTCGPSSTWDSEGSYAGCKATNEVMAVGCSGTIIYGENNVWATCAQGHTCASLKVYETQNDLTASWTMISCTSDWEANSIYRHLTASPTATPSPVGPSETDAGKITPTSSPTATSTYSAGGTASPQPSGHSGLSAGAIAGIVVGCVAAIVILFLLIFRRKILACFGYTRTDSQPAYSSVYIPPPMQSPQSSQSPFYAQSSRLSHPPSQAGWDKPELPGEGVRTSVGPPHGASHREVSEME